jgi:Na+-translocating ferredoxin:NAD+ oxidoreductase RnfG subunit
MKSVWLILFLLLASSLLIAGQINSQQAPTASAAQTEKELKRITQELLDAVAPANKAVWDRYLAHTCLYTDENGRTLTKAQLLEELRPLPAGYKGTIQLVEAQVRDYGDTAVITHRDIEHEEVFGQKITTEYHITDTYLHRDGRWQMIASHVQVIPSERKSVTLDAKIYDAFVGQYQLAPGAVYSITREGNGLMGQRNGRAKEELLPANENTFFRKGSVRGEKIFVKDEKGRVMQMIDRRDNNDIVWKKVK